MKIIHELLSNLDHEASIGDIRQIGGVGLLTMER